MLIVLVMLTLTWTKNCVGFGLMMEGRVRGLRGLGRELKWRDAYTHKHTRAKGMAM